MAAMLVHLTKEDDQNSLIKEHQRGGYEVKSAYALYFPKFVNNSWGRHKEYQ